MSTSAIARIEAMRREQAERWGHTPESDLALPLKALPDRAAGKIVRAREDIHFRAPHWREQALRHLAQAGALIAAAIDRLEAEEADPEPPTTTTATGAPL